MNSGNTTTATTVTLAANSIVEKCLLKLATEVTEQIRDKLIDIMLAVLSRDCEEFDGESVRRHIIAEVKSTPLVFELEKRVAAIESRLDVIETRLAAIESRLDVIETRLDALENRVAALEQHHAERLADLEKALAESSAPLTAYDVLGTLFRRKLDTHQTTFAMGEAIAHLHYLRFAGLVKRSVGADGVVRYAPLAR